MLEGQQTGNSGKLGFGLMRLPRKGIAIDIEQFQSMVDLFLASGQTYFDTAYVYPGSEAATKIALVDRHPRESYTLATKLFASLVPTAGLAKRELRVSLKRTGAGYIDYYLLHSLMELNYKKFDTFGLWDFVREQKRKGTIKHFGFSFHGGPELLDQLLTEHPDTEFVQLQINYADWEHKKIASRQNYEVARKHNKPIMVMEPVKGGILANPPDEIQQLFKAANPDASPASWALRFAASLDGVHTVLSGMSNMEQMQDNLNTFKDFQLLDETEQRVIRDAQRIMGNSKTIPCTACGYCVDGCPKKILIPEVFAAMNLQIGQGRSQEAQERYQALISKGGRASDCIHCGKCEKTCPQKIEIIDQLAEGVHMFE